MIKKNISLKFLIGSILILVGLSSFIFTLWSISKVARIENIEYSFYEKLRPYLAILSTILVVLSGYVIIKGRIIISVIILFVTLIYKYL